MLNENGDSQQDDSRNDKSKLTFQRMLMVMMMLVIMPMMMFVFMIMLVLMVLMFVLRSNLTPHSTLLTPRRTSPRTTLLM